MSEAPDGAAAAVTDSLHESNIDAAQNETSAAQVQEQQPGDDAAAATDQGEGEQPKPRKSAQERIDEVTRARREAEREAEYWKAKALQAPQQTQQPQHEADTGDPEPDPQDFEYGESDARFIRAHATWTAKREVERQFQERAERDAEEATLRQFQERVERFADQTPDLYDVVGQNFERAAAVMTSVMQQAARTAEEAPQLAYHLAKHPAEARRIAALNPYAQAVEIGKLAARLSSPSAPARPPPKTATDAPEPAPQARGSGGRFTVPPDTNDFAAFEKQYGN